MKILVLLAAVPWLATVLVTVDLAFGGGNLPYVGPLECRIMMAGNGCLVALMLAVWPVLVATAMLSLTIAGAIIPHGKQSPQNLRAPCPDPTTPGQP